eukprot:TRINITY_DN15742_c0_g2_i1.p1 TRINITY_DN15742_c0_g2~~TRINITY_DN15742_c0_g2_i1.p1  ORF type:complete len:498 (+),score=85.91 TRINITY_DN15742_c0_g2_i1:72-1565(+)
MTASNNAAALTPLNVLRPALERAATKKAASRKTHGKKVSLSRAAGRDKNSHKHLTKQHSSIRHLYACERRHCWQWVPDRRLSSLWHKLSAQQRSALVLTHSRDRPDEQFVKDLKEQLRQVDCGASETAKSSLGAIILNDQSSLSLYKEIFIAAVTENLPMIIDMEVVASVDGIVQDYRLAVAERSLQQGWPSSVVLPTLALTVFLFWLLGSACAWVVAVAAVLAGLAHASVRLMAKPVDPRTFEEGTDLWRQYREREHVRLMWMSAMVRVFEARLLCLWEERQRLQQFSLEDGKCSEAAKASCRPPGLQPLQLPPDASGSADFTTRLADLRKNMRRRKGDSCAVSEHQLSDVEGGAGESDSLIHEATSASKHPGRIHRGEADAAAGPVPATSNRCPVEVEFSIGQGLSSDLADAFANDQDDDDYVDDAAESGDAIDAEFARRVKEHLQSREQAANKGNLSQTERGNQILKTLCEKLKGELERKSFPPRRDEKSHTHS